MHHKIKFGKNIAVFALFFLIVLFVAASSLQAQVAGGNDLTVQPDGKILIYGDNIIVNGTPRNRIVRLSQDGILDNTFNYNDSSSSIRSAVVQPDGKIVVAGSKVDPSIGFSGALVRRLNSDGTFDSTFTELYIPPTPSPATSFATVWAIQPDGKILISVRTSAFGQEQYEVRRLNANGGADSTFTNITVSFGGLQSIYYITKVALQADGKILISSRAALIAGAPGRVARYNQNGTADPTFAAPSISGSNGGYVEDLIVGADGGIVFGGSFATVNSVSRNNLAKLLPNGNLDTALTSPLSSSEAVSRIAFTTNNQIIVSTANRFIKLNANGTIDASFNSPSSITQINAWRLDSQNRIVFIGSATENGMAVSRLRRLNADGSFDLTFGVRRPQFDFDGDRKADISLFRPSNGTWYILPSQTNGFYGFPFGQAGDLLAPADYDGDGKTDVAVFRDTFPGGNFAYFYILNSSDNSFRAVQFGANADVPLAGDWDGDGKADLAVYRATSFAGGQSYFYYRPSSQPTVNFNTIPLGTFGDKPIYGEFDGDGRLDPAVFRPSTASWIILKSSLNQIQTTSFGLSTDVPVPADYDGDGITNIAVFRPSNGTWYTNQNPQTNFGAIQFGASGDLPVPADYDGDGKADTAVFRPLNGAWFLNRTTSGLSGVQFGANGDKPAPNAYIP